MLGLLCGWLVAEIASGFLSCDLLVGVKCNAVQVFLPIFTISLFLSLSLSPPLSAPE